MSVSCLFCFISGVTAPLIYESSSGHEGTKISNVFLVGALLNCFGLVMVIILIWLQNDVKKRDR